MLLGRPWQSHGPGRAKRGEPGEEARARAARKASQVCLRGQNNARPLAAPVAGGRTTYHRPGTDQPVVIIEFKKPARDDYNDDENPFTQIYGYIIADLTPKLRRWLKMAQINVPLPGGGGFYGYNDDYKAFVQALSYKYVLKDARMRNEAFFKHLSI